MTGHSLGGAMASIAAARLLDEDKPFIAVYTFGQPRCMKRKTAQIFNAEVGGRCHRFQNNEDIVTRVPARVTGYRHVGRCLYIDRDGVIQTDPGFWYKFLDLVSGAVEKIATTAKFAMIAAHDIDAYLAAIRGWDVGD